MTTKQTEAQDDNPPWPLGNARPGTVWGAYRLDYDGWWRLNVGIPPGELVRLNPKKLLT